MIKKYINFGGDNINIDQLKMLQLKIIKKNKVCNFIITIVALIILLISSIIFFIDKTEWPFILITLFVELIICSMIISIIKNIVNGNDIQIFYKNFKNVFVLKSLQNNFDNVVYNPSNGFPETMINEIGMLNTGDRYYSNDYVSGTYNDIGFEQSDVHIEEKHEEKDEDGNKNVVWETLFRGRIMIFDFNKKFKSNIQVISYHFDAGALPWGERFSRVKMEDVEFNKELLVYAQNEHDAFYVLTPHFMEKIKEITEKIGCGIMFSFVDNKLHIAIDNNEDSFECDVFKIINEQAIEEDITRDIKIIKDFVDELNLDNNLFKNNM